MADLRSLVYTLNVPAETNYPSEFLVYNTNITTPSNGGCCCLWTVPAGVTWVQFEIWGGGGGGGGACCCQSGVGSGSGAYSLKAITTTAGCQYTICAGGTTNASPVCLGSAGNTSFVTGYNLSNFCATGGAPGDTHCNWMFSNSNCYAYPHCCCAYGGDINIHGTKGSMISSASCSQYHQSYSQTAPKAQAGPFIGPGGCINGSPNGSCFNWMTYAPFPGGGGLSAQAYSNNCWCGGWGAGGLVSVTYG